VEKIRLLVADDATGLRNAIREYVSLEEDIEIVGEAINGEEALKKVERLLPDVVLMDVNMPVINGIEATEKISIEHPEIAVIMMSVISDNEYMKKSMNAGSRDYLQKPFTHLELISAIRTAYNNEQSRKNRMKLVKNNGSDSDIKTPQIVTVFGTKGGVGKTTLAVNLAVQTAKTTGKKVLLLDLDLQFGDVAVYMNIMPKRSISELAQEKNKLNIELVESYLITHQSGVKILPAPIRPEYAEIVNAEFVQDLLTLLRSKYDYIIIDTPPVFHDTLLGALDMSTQIFIIMSMDLPTIKNIKLCMELLKTLHLDSKVKMVLNRASEDFGVTIKDCEEVLDMKIGSQIPSDGKIVVKAANRGIPFVITSPNAKVTEAITDITKLMIYDKGYQKELQKSHGKKTFFGFGK